MQKTNLNPPQNHAVNNIPCFKCASNEPLGIQDNISTVLDLKDYKFVSQLPGVSSASTKKSRWTRKSLVSRITLLTGVFGSTTVLEKNELFVTGNFLFYVGQYLVPRFCSFVSNWYCGNKKSSSPIFLVIIPFVIRSELSENFKISESYLSWFYAEIIYSCLFKNLHHAYLKYFSLKGFSFL